MQVPLVPITLAFLLGLVLATGLAPHPVGLAGAGLLSAGVVCLGRRRAKTRTLAVFALWLCLGALRMAAWQAHLEVRLRDAKLRELAEKTGRSISEFVREAVERW